MSRGKLSSVAAALTRNIRRDTIFAHTRTGSMRPAARPAQTGATTAGYRRPLSILRCCTVLFGSRHTVTFMCTSPVRIETSVQRIFLAQWYMATLAVLAAVLIPTLLLHCLSALWRRILVRDLAWNDLDSLPEGSFSDLASLETL